ncbi:MAG: hemolysin family protein [Acidobacteriia bacterium]|nr:hemolysin family protein [Terriglobia bacterium]
MTIGTTVVLLLVGIAFSALFSGAETALTALPFARVAALAKRGGRARRWAWQRWTTRPQRVLTAILAGNTLVNIGVSAIVTNAAVNVFGNKGIGLAIGATTLAVLMFGEVTPKALARTEPEALARRVIVPVATLEWLLTPVTVPLLGLSHVVARIRRISLEHTHTASRPEDVRFLLSIAKQEGHVSELEHAMLEGVLRFEGAHVRDVQKPRTDVVFLPDTLTFDEVKAKVVSHGYSRYPVYHGRDDHVVGILLAKDLLRPQEPGAGWSSLLQPGLFVPESKRAVDLLREMRERRTHIALSVDEHGNLAGLVTLEDLLEMIVGDIQDEFDTAKPLAQRDGIGRWLVRGALPLDRLARITGRQIPSEPDYTSVAGLLLAQAGRVPAVGSRFEIGDLLLEVVEASPRRIELVRVTIAEPTA